jgi:hypothetical protein
MSFADPLLPVLFVLLSSAATSPASLSRPAGPLGPSREEVLDLQVDPTVGYRVVVSDPIPVVPSAALPRELELQRSNNNLAIALHQGRLFLAFRSAPIHFASPNARIVVLSSPDLGSSWTLESVFSTGQDLREPFLLEVGGQLRLYFAELDGRFYVFEPRALWRTSRCGPGCWSTPEKWGGPEEIAWDFKVRDGRAWMTSYRHKRYDASTRPVELHFQTSTDGLDWRDLGGAPIYRGGATETSFEFDRGGELWAVTRNEDGDRSGFGSHVASAEPGNLGAWRFPAKSDSAKYDSPRMFRHGGEIFLVARRNLGPAFGTRFPSFTGGMRKLLEWASYSLQPKRTALYRLDRAARRFETIVDLPSAGDTAFPSIVRLSPHEYLVANYSSAFRHKDRSWVWGQLNGTGIYFVRLRFEPLRAGERETAPAAEPPGLAAPTREGAVTFAHFNDDWPMREDLHVRMAGLGVASAVACLLVRRRWRALARAAPKAPSAA